MLDAAIATLRELSSPPTELSTFLARIDGLGPGVVDYLLKLTGKTTYSRLLWLKIANLLVGRFQFQRGQTVLAARPLGLIVDPSNSCPLRCPGCLRNELSRQSGKVDWTGGHLRPKIYDQFLRQYGPYALHLHLFNWGEPLLNQNTPAFVARAKGYGLCTVISSNLSVPFDAEALVLSGLDFLIMSIDGATAETYRRYRRGGDFGLVLANVKKLVAAKEKYHLQTPRLNWQFLTFQHNVAEMDAARGLAAELGVDEIRFAPPYDVSWSDPSIAAAPLPEQLLRLHPEKGTDLGREKITQSGLGQLGDGGEQPSWLSRLPAGAAELPRAGRGKVCQWLYKNMVMDAHGRILPCCYAPQKSDQYRYIFSQVVEGELDDHYNSTNYEAARRAFVAAEPASLLPAEGKEPFCQVCRDPNQQRPSSSTDLIRTYFANYYLGSLPIAPLIGKDNLDWLADWESSAK